MVTLSARRGAASEETRPTGEFNVAPVEGSANGKLVIDLTMHHIGRLLTPIELTVKDGRVVYDLNGISRPDWQTLPAGYGPIGDGRWDGLNPSRGTTPGTQRGRGGAPQLRQSGGK